MATSNNKQTDSMHKNKQLKRSHHDVDKVTDDTNQLSIDDMEIKTILHALSNKMDAVNNAVAEVDKRLDIKIDSMEMSLRSLISGVQESMEQKLSSFSTDIDHRLKEMGVACNNNCDDKIGELSSKIYAHVDELHAMQEYRIDKLERSALSKEVIISGVPMEHNDNAYGVVGDICQALNCNLNQRDFAAIYRLKSNSKNNNSNQSVQIVAKLYDDGAVRELFSCYFKRGDLCLKDIGFKSNARIYINESLTKSNREIFKLASEAKKANLIMKFHTRNGLVHIQRDDNSKPIRVHHIGELEQILPPQFERSADIPNQQRSNTRAAPKRAINRFNHRPQSSPNQQKSNSTVIPNAGILSNQPTSMEVESDAGTITQPTTINSS